MTRQFPSDFLAESPPASITTLNGDDYLLVGEDQATSPASWAAKVVKASDLRKYAYQATSTAKTANFTLALTDGPIIYVTISGSPLADITCTIPTNASVAFPVGTILQIILENNGGASPANKVVITGATGVTVNGTSAGSVNLEGNYSGVSLHQKSANNWVIVGAIS